MQKKQRTLLAEERCARHGLVAKRNGACPLCVIDVRRAKIARAIGIVAVTLVAATASISFAWRRAANHTARAAPPSSKAVTSTRAHSGFDSIVGASRDNQVEASPRALGEAVAATAPTRLDAEDRNLGAPPLGVAVPAMPPPEPPRADVDPEPTSPDDPRDFDVYPTDGHR